MSPPHPSHGFTIIEVVIALLIGSILTSIALSSFGNARGAFAVRGARDTYASMVARARAQAIEQGRNVWLMTDPAGDSVWIYFDSDSSTQEVIRFAEEFNVDIQADSRFRLCMNPRGYADTDCNSFSTVLGIRFVQNADVEAVRLLPLGQLIY